VPEIAIALKSAGFDILAAGPVSADDTPRLEANSVDCYVQLPSNGSPSGGGALRRTRDAIAHELLNRFDTTARLLPLLAPTATVVLVTDGPGPEDSTAGEADPERDALRSLVGVLAQAIQSECGRAGIQASVVGDDRSPEEIAVLAGQRPKEPLPWWLYADLDPDLGFTDWRDSVLCRASEHQT
jgi:hypothetical protein